MASEVYGRHGLRGGERRAPICAGIPEVKQRGRNRRRREREEPPTFVSKDIQRERSRNRDVRGAADDRQAQCQTGPWDGGAAAQKSPERYGEEEDGRSMLEHRPAGDAPD